MKRYWHAWLTMVAVATMVTSASAQSGSNYSPEIGSYQSIMARAGYGGSPAQGSNYGNGMGMQQATPAYGQPAPSGGSFVPNQMVQGGQMYNTPMAPNSPPSSAPLPSAPMQGTVQGYGGCGGQAASGCGSQVSGGYGGCGGPVSGGYTEYASQGYTDAGYGNSGCGAPVYSAGQSIGGIGAVAGCAPAKTSNWVVSAAGVVFVRDYEDSRIIARNPAGDRLFTTDADQDSIGGVDVSIANRKQCGNGWEARYFGLFPDTASRTLTGAPVSSVGLRGLDRLLYNGNGVDTYFSNGTSQTVTRDSDIQNLEFNLLRNGGQYCTRGGKSANFELLGGFRYFQFDEHLRYSTADGTTPLDYDLDVENTLLGLQLGARTEVCLGQRLRLAGMTKVGIFNNNVQTQQSITDAAGVYATVNGTGRDFNYGDEKNDVAMLGELDLGLIFQVSCRARIRFGYKAIGVAGVALAADQIPYEFDNTYALQSANSNGNLLLHGGYFGTEFCF